MLKSILTALLVVTTLASQVNAQNQVEVSPRAPAPDCHARVNYNLNKILPGYLNQQDLCQPFTSIYQVVPGDYKGGDYYGEEFTDSKIRERWKTCKQDEACRIPAMKGALSFIKSEKRDTGSVDPFGKIDPDGHVNLSLVRRPDYFGRQPYDEPIGMAESHTYTIEFTVPRDTFERMYLGKTGNIKLRGWYLKGSRVTGDGAAPTRALVIMNNGGGGEITAIDQRGFEGVVFNPRTGGYVRDVAADGSSEQPGMRNWRGFVADLNNAGFDVLVTDRRGNGISGGEHGFDTLEQGNDIFREIDQLGSGDGLRILTPAKETISGKAAVTALFGQDDATKMPIVLGGYSRGSYAVEWAMHTNFVEDCDTDVNPPKCAPPRENANIKGAILYGPNAGGLGYRAAGHAMQEAALRVEFNTTYRLDSAVFVGIGKWPGVAIIKGTWGYPESLEGSFEAYKRAKEPKDIFVFHGPHQLETQSPENMALVGQRMVAFAKTAVLGEKQVPGALHPKDLKDLVLSSPDYWELTTKPTVGSQTDTAQPPGQRP